MFLKIFPNFFEFFQKFGSKYLKFSNMHLWKAKGRRPNAGEFIKNVGEKSTETDNFQKLS